jgi:hypothetical protein
VTYAQLLDAIEQATLLEKMEAEVLEQADEDGGLPTELYNELLRVQALLAEEIKL